MTLPCIKCGGLMLPDLTGLQCSACGIFDYSPKKFCPDCDCRGVCTGHSIGRGGDGFTSQRSRAKSYFCESCESSPELSDQITYDRERWKAKEATA